MENELVKFMINYLMVIKILVVLLLMVVQKAFYYLVKLIEIWVRIKEY